jgi:heme/copper-type cytochrome/quinol oxidase subunit 2
MIAFAKRHPAIRLMVAAAALALIATGGATASLQGSGASASPAAKQQAGTVQHLTLYIFRGVQHIKGPDGKSHDTVVPSNFVVKAGVPVQVKVINNDEAGHSITAPTLGFDKLIKPGKETAPEKVTSVTTTFTFTAKKKGVFRWYCKIPCDHKAGLWAMTPGYSGPSKEGFMAGFIVVV